jgi:hypothetical protein
MDFFLLLTMLAAGVFVLRFKDQKRRINLLGSHLRKHQIEKLMETLTEGYARALGEDDAQRRTQIWNLLASSEISLSEQFNRFATEFARVDEAETRISKFAVAFPFADKIFPSATFDVRQALAIHAQGISNAANNTRNLSPKGKAFSMSAELFLMQHTCHWFCRSKSVASARMLVRHKTSYAQLIEAAAPDTRQAYRQLTGD